jgi:excisionase family DNA binding protein
MKHFFIRTTSEAATAFNVTPRTIRRWCETGRLSAIRTRGGHWLIAASQCPHIPKAARRKETPTTARRQRVITTFDPDVREDERPQPTVHRGYGRDWYPRP